MQTVTKIGEGSLRVDDDGVKMPPPHERGYHIWGCNPFYDGYIAFLLGEPKPEENAHGSVDGWQMAAETVGLSTNRPGAWTVADAILSRQGTQLWAALVMEIEAGHILILPQSTKELKKREADLLRAEADRIEG